MAISTYVTVKSLNEYPRLKKSPEGYVYLFISEYVGVPLNDPDYNRDLDIGDITEWNTSKFKDFDGSITLQN